MNSANGRKPKYTGEFEIWGTDACRNYDYCGGRITLFVANKKCISCDPESYKKREVLPADSAKDEWKDRFENADTIARAYASECGVLRGELDYHKNQLAKAQAEIERLKKDKARLDWVIETKSQAHKTDKGWFTFPINILGDFTSSPREAIDAAMKESKDGK